MGLNSKRKGRRYHRIESFDYQIGVTTINGRIVGATGWVRIFLGQPFSDLARWIRARNYQVTIWSTPASGPDYVEKDLSPILDLSFEETMLWIG